MAKQVTISKLTRRYRCKGIQSDCTVYMIAKNGDIQATNSGPLKCEHNFYFTYSYSQPVLVFYNFFSTFFTVQYSVPGFQIRIKLNPDSDLAKNINPDPDPEDPESGSES